MSQNQPCPNGSCSHVFPAAAVAGAGSVKCPSCGTVFQSRARPKVVKPEPPLALPVNGGEAEAFDFSGGSVVPRAVARPRWNFAPWLLFVICGAVVAGGVYGLRSGLFSRVAGDVKGSLAARPELPQGPGVYFPEMNCRFDYPSPAWEKDDALKNATRTNALALSRKDPDLALTLSAKDYKTTNPDVGALVDEAVRRLGGYFATFEYEQKEEVELAGHKGQRLAFQGKFGDQLMGGECYLLAHKGIGYWLVTWTSAEEIRRQPEQVRQEFERVRKSLTLGHERDLWKETVTGVTFTGTRAPYQFQNVPGLWQKWPEPSSEDDGADLMLIGNDPEAAGDIKRKATVLVLLLDRKETLNEAAAAARAHVEAQHKKTFDPVMVEVLSEEEKAVGGQLGHVAKLHVRDGETRERFVLMATLLPPASEHLLVIQCECDWRRRPRWEALFQQLLGQFSLKAE